MKRVLTIVTLVLILVGCSEKIPKPAGKRPYSEYEFAAMKEYTNEKRAYIENCMNEWNDRYGIYYNDFNDCVRDYVSRICITPREVYHQDNTLLKSAAGAAIGYGAGKLLFGGKK